MEKNKDRIWLVYPIGLVVFFVIMFGLKIEAMTNWSGLGWLVTIILCIFLILNFVMISSAKEEIIRKIEEKRRTEYGD